MFSTKAMRGGKQSLGTVQLLTQMPRRKTSSGAGSELFQQQSKSGGAQLGNRQELSSLANGHLGHSKSPQLLEKPKNQQWRPNLISHMQHLSALAHPALANSQYPPIGPQNLEVHPVKKHDPKEMQEILDLFLDQFLYDEPLSYSLKLTREQAIPFFRDIVAACSRDNPAVSLLVRDSATSDNRLVGVLLNQLIRRENINDNLYEDRSYSPNVKEYCKIVHICEAAVWDLLPKDINLACNNVFMSVHRDYQQMGIGQKMVELSELNVQQMEGVQAAVGELTSTGTQRIYAKCGYTPLLTVPYTGWLNEQGQQIVKTRDGAEGMQLVGKFYCYS